MKTIDWINLLRSPRFLILFCLGFSSGLPLALTGSALEARFASSSVSITTIGFISLVGMPYVFKFLWAPLMDCYVPPLLGRRRGWILLCQLVLILLLIAMAMCSPGQSPVLLAFFALLTAFVSASQDIAIDAYRTDVLLPEERGLGMGFFVAAYRAAMLVSGSIGFILADQIGWEITYLIMAACMLVGVLATWYAEQPANEAYHPTNLIRAYQDPFRSFFNQKSAWLLLLLIVSYKLGDAFVLKLQTTFFIRGLAFTMTEIGTVNKLGGFAAMLLGIFMGGVIIARIRLYHALLAFGLLQACSCLMYIWLAAVDKNFSLFVSTVVIENFCSGLGNAAFFAFLMSLCDKRYSAAQFALFSALAAVPREVLGPLAAQLVVWYGWQGMYQIAFFASFPSLIILLCNYTNFQRTLSPAR